MSPTSSTTPLPTIHIDAVQKIYDDGNHNAFTDLCRFNGRLYLAFRSCPDGHQVFPTSQIVVLSSLDGTAWDPAFRFSVPDRDVRDPHFLVFCETLFVYSGAWLCNPRCPEEHGINEHLGYAAWTSDGRTWQGPQSLEGTYGHYIWRAAAFGDTAYLCGRRTRDFVPPDHPDPSTVVRQSALLESQDGLVWKWRSLFRATQGNETAFLFEPDGELLAIVRDGTDSQLCRARPPYRAWTRKGLGCFIGGPLMARWGGRILVGGRKTIGPSEHRTVLYWLHEDRLVEAAELPSGGDTSYPGFIELNAAEGWLSYYSSHEGSRSKTAPCSIYLARLRAL